LQKKEKRKEKKVKNKSSEVQKKLKTYDLLAEVIAVRPAA
jgi:hypothetical protein